MSRDQADRVALAVDNRDRELPNDPSIVRYGGIVLMKAMVTGVNPAEPLTDTFYKNAIASGSIVPPSGEGAVRRADFIVGYVVLMLIGMGAIFLLTALIRW